MGIVLSANGQVCWPYKVKRPYESRLTPGEKYDKRGARDSLVPRPTSTRGVITHAYACGPRRRKQERGRFTRFTAEKRGLFFGVCPRKLNVATLSRPAAP